LNMTGNLTGLFTNSLIWFFNVIGNREQVEDLIGKSQKEKLTSASTIQVYNFLKQSESVNKASTLNSNVDAALLMDISDINVESIEVEPMLQNTSSIVSDINEYKR